MTAKGITVLEDAIEDCDGELIVNSKKAPSKEAIRLDCFASEKKVPVIAIVIK
jgi:hypothetical protein